MTNFNGIGGIYSIGNGKFIYDGREVSFEDMVFLVQLEVINRVDEQFAAKFNEIKERNRQIKEINDILQMLRKYSQYFDKDGNWIGKDEFKVGDKTGKFSDADMKKWMEFWNKYVKTGKITAGGMEDGNFYKSEIDAAMENCKAYISNLNAENELDMMVLNKWGNQRNSYMQLMKSLLEKIAQARGEAARL